MLYHNPYPTWLYILRKAYFKVATPIKKFYYFLFRPKTNGVKVIATHDNKVLLVRIGYGHKKWALPGGKVNKGEEFREAALRELKEESGLVLDEVVCIGSFYSEKEYKKDTVQYFVGETKNEDLVIDDQEIVDAGWFSLDKIPLNRGQRVDEGIKLYNDWKHGKN